MKFVADKYFQSSKHSPSNGIKEINEMKKPKKRSSYNIQNKFAEKFKTQLQRKKLLTEYLAHISSGYSDKSFTVCDMDTFNNYCTKYPNDFPTDMIEQGRRERLFFWEKIGIEGTTGKIQGYNSRSWEFNMKNRFRWSEKIELESRGNIVTSISFVERKTDTKELKEK